jgi:hypothetical protein
MGPPQRKDSFDEELEQYDRKNSITKQERHDETPKVSIQNNDRPSQSNNNVIQSLAL